MNDKLAGLTQTQLDAHWMSYTGNRQFKRDPRIITAADGCYYTSADGRPIFDGLSGLWTCGAGHNRKDIAKAISQQLAKLDYAPAFQFGHPGSFALAERITQLMPEGLNRVFFTNSGSDAVETSLKIARAYWRKKGLASKTKLIGRSKGYHGVNFGGVSVGGIRANRAIFGPALSTSHLPHTLLSENRFSRGQPECGAHLAEALLDIIDLHDASNIAAVIIEPMAGSAGVLPPPEGYLQRLRDICEQHQILLIFDEVITAFGRLGSATGAEIFGVVPDILNTAKQLTNGVIPMGAVVVQQEIYESFLQQGGPDYQLELPHGYTYSAHPVACAAALATLDILERDNLFKRSAELAYILEDYIHQLRNLPLIYDIRNCGLAAALTIESAPGEPLLRPFLIALKMWDKGFYIRYSGNTLQLGVPFISRSEEIDGLINALAESILEVANGQ
ncbi:aspartate aminotransferase family protein [uncultured Microbulbifer sp.]|uniref:aspartate aminotransferase family protein n=1 Tax=uncultured Microbulbifer sp. TaxID=348147 RepID=UPI0026050EE3|nr:aspartate aminotransferase family protein [uncultured Microbulbifer sp.]